MKTHYYKQTVTNRNAYYDLLDGRSTTMFCLLTENRLGYLILGILELI